MTKHFCDKCGAEASWKKMVRIYGTRDESNDTSEINDTFELCSNCYHEFVIAIKENVWIKEKK